MEFRDAMQIADLLNTRNRLQRPVEWRDVYDDASQYRFLRDGDKLMGCIQMRAVQWYQTELLHLAVAQEYEGRRLAIKLGKMAEEWAIGEGARILQATVREDNTQMVRGLQLFNWTIVNKFYNHRTENNVLILQKVLSHENAVHSAQPARRVR
jgi:ribosomal protein S18 acetylase RimI-like enzyme